jgi:hypothetical protein
MTIRKTFIYTQVRLQARHGMRPDEHIWQIVESKKELENYLQAASKTPLKNWVAGLQAKDSHHVIETALMKRYREYVADVASWVPPPWRDAVQWIVCLTYLPAFNYMLTGNTAYQWMLEDPHLKNFTAVNPELRLDNFSRSPYAPLLGPWQANQSLVKGWLAHWQSLWPEKKASQQAPNRELIAIVEAHIDLFKQLAPTVTWRQRQRLVAKLTLMFRKYAFEPVAVFIHLLLVALDVERLRGSIARRHLFPRYQEAGA